MILLSQLLTIIPLKVSKQVGRYIQLVHMLQEDQYYAFAGKVEPGVPGGPYCNPQFLALIEVKPYFFIY